MYKPTIVELEELGFKPHVSNDNFMVKDCGSSGNILYDIHLNIFSTTPLYLYPRNTDDIKNTIDIISHVI